jgi:NAD(P)-dependent dehydrogenase (short-subunit alcohol dehydrogenase family)
MARAVTNALVTGGAQRVGEAMVRDLASHGFGVAIHCNGSRDAAEVLAARIADGGGRAAVVQADLTDRKAVAGLVDEAIAAVGPIGLLVNNASLFHADSPTDFDWQAWDDHFALHVAAPAALARHFSQSLAPDAKGLIINVIDQRVWRLTPRHYSYTLSKSALWTATRTLAQALAPRIRVNAIGPGPTLRNQRQSEADFEAQQAALLLGHGPELEEFGATIRYLWETPSVTGQMIALDGGQHLAWETPDVAGIEE